MCIAGLMAVEGLKIETVGTPPLSCRVKAGQVKTVGEFRKLIALVPDNTPLMVRNGPLPTIYVHCYDGQMYVELD